MEDCIFCKIVKGEIPSKKVFEDEFILALHDINPVAPVHILIIPKKHITNLASIQPEDKSILGHIQMTIPDIAKKFKIDKAFRTMNANGEFAGQTVMHLHYHLVGGWKNKATEEDLIRESKLNELK